MFTIQELLAAGIVAYVVGLVSGVVTSREICSEIYERELRRLARYYRRYE